MLVILWIAGWSHQAIKKAQVEEEGGWRHPLHADAFGYYVYLPGAIHSGMLVDGTSDHFRLRLVQNGIDTTGGKIVTKYTYVTALMQLPFYLAAELIEGWGVTDGTSDTHVKLMVISGITYWTIGLLLLGRVLLRRSGLGVGWTVVLLGLASFTTPLFYYAYRMPGYSHVYSFFLVTVLLYTLPWQAGDRRSDHHSVLHYLAGALLIVARPVDVVIVMVLFAWSVGRVRDPGWAARALAYHTVALLVVALPQFIYWNWAHGEWLHYSYQGEGFDHWSSPRIGLTLFAARNGLIPWAPLFAFFPLAAFYAARARAWLAVMSAVAIILILYLNASWHDWAFGCSFGQRATVQYVPLLLLVLAPMVHKLAESPRILRTTTLLFLLFMCRTWYFMALDFDVCYFQEPWDFSGYFALMQAAMS
ncbi:MAG: hypothetical protein KDB88_12550 [Flavobacteriales bacterium]|nr:hypothetical protein [Flavobacteriales bacterium]